MASKLDLIKQELAHKKLDAFLVSSVSDITYLTSYSNFSIHEREAYLLITKTHQYIFTDGRYVEAIKKQVKNFTVIDNRANPFKESLKKLIQTHKIDFLGIDENSLTISEYKYFRKIFKKVHNFNTVNSRIIKTDTEIGAIEKACDLADKALNHVIKKLKVGVTEKEIAYEFENYVKKFGADISFDTIVAFGANSSIPHHQTGDEKLKKNNIVLIDFGVKLNNYCSDCTRTFFFGKAPEEFKKMYNAVLESQTSAVSLLNSYIKNGSPIKASLVDKKARKYLISKGYPSIPHSLGHGIGLEVHEKPWVSIKSKDILKLGMVFSIEPGIYIPNFGGVRIEDLYVFKEKDLHQITKTPKHLRKI